MHKKLGNEHLTSMYISWGADLDPKGANGTQVREASDLLINNSVVPDLGELEPRSFCRVDRTRHVDTCRIYIYICCNFSLGGVLSSNEREQQQVESTPVDSSSIPSQESIIETVDMDETL